MGKLAASVLVACSIGLGSAGFAAEATDPVAEPAVKLSRSGICHERTSPNYRQLKTYDAFQSLADCLSAGGRLPDGTRSMPYEPRPPNPPWWRTLDAEDWIGAAVVVFLIVVVLIPLLYSRWRTRRVYRRAEDAARRRWEGHRLDRRERDKSR